MSQLIKKTQIANLKRDAAIKKNNALEMLFLELRLSTTSLLKESGIRLIETKIGCSVMLTLYVNNYTLHLLWYFSARNREGKIVFSCEDSPKKITVSLRYFSLCNKFIISKISTRKHKYNFRWASPGIIENIISELI